MSWQGEMTTMVRYLINDADSSNYTYSDERIETTVLVSAQLVISEVDFENTYTVDVEQCYLSPDPTDPTSGLTTANKDDGFISLVSLKASCILLGSEMKTHALTSVRVTDGPSSVDCTSVAKYLQALHKNACDAYEDYKFNYAAGSSAGSSGKAILTPYSPGSNIVLGHYTYYSNGNFR